MSTPHDALFKAVLGDPEHARGELRSIMPPEPEQLQQLLDRVVGPNAKDTIMTAGERLIQQGEERGILKGIQQGEERGILKGKCDVLLLVLQQRFGSQVSADVERRLTTASAEQITAWASRVMSAATLAELLAD